VFESVVISAFGVFHFKKYQIDFLVFYNNFDVLISKTKNIFKKNILISFQAKSTLKKYITP